MLSSCRNISINGGRRHGDFLVILDYSPGGNPDLGLSVGYQLIPTVLIVYDIRSHRAHMIDVSAAAKIVAKTTSLGVDKPMLCVPANLACDEKTPGR